VLPWRDEHDEAGPPWAATSMARPRERTAGRIDSTADRWPGSAFFRYQITDLHLVTASG